MTFDRLHGATDLEMVRLAELGDIQLLVTFQFREDLGPEAIAESAKQVFQNPSGKTVHSCSLIH